MPYYTHGIRGPIPPHGDRFIWGAPFLGGLLGGALGTALIAPAVFRPPGAFYGPGPYGPPPGPFYGPGPYGPPPGAFYGQGPYGPGSSALINR